MKVLDLFCGPGGAGYGYYLAGFEVVGVDSEPQPRYPFTFVRADALTFPLDGFDVIHASPPCQEYSVSRSLRKVASKHGVKHTLKLIAPIRERLEASGKPWIIENVAFSDLPDALELCGSMFDLPGLPIQRHRWFACSHLLFAPGPCRHADGCINPVGGKIRGYGRFATGKRFIDARGRTRKREGYFRLAEGRKAMGIPWMSMSELSQAIPPAYTEWIGKQLIEVL